MASSFDARAFARLRAAGFICPATKLQDYDLPRLGHTIGVGEDELHAVLDVETAGGGFDKLKKPKQLFEPHVFYRNLSGAARDRAVSLGLAYPAWRAGNYPTDSYPRLAQALAINETAALKACSWGLGQILGENYKAAGYVSPQAMVLAFCDGGEAEHLAAMVRFIKANHLDDELRAHDWAGFARGYNGPGYAKNGYDTKLAARFKWWQARPDTPWSPPAAEPAPDPLAPLVAAPIVLPPTAPPQAVLPPVPPVAAAPKPAPPPQPTVTTGGLWAALRSLFSKKDAS